VIQETYSKEFFIGLDRLGLYDEAGELLIFTSDIDEYTSNPMLWFSLERASSLDATAVLFRKTVGDKLLPQVYIYDFTHTPLLNTTLTDIHKKIWSSGEVPLVCAFFRTEIKVLECTSPINADKDEPTYLAESLSLVGKIDKIFNKNFAAEVKTGVFWSDIAFKNKFDARCSAHDLLITYLRDVISNFINKSGVSEYTAQKLIIQSILVKYLEERVDNQGKGVFPSDYFRKYQDAESFCDVLRNGRYLQLFADLHNNHFSGRIFEWKNDEISELRKCDLTELANALDGKSSSSGQLYIGFWKQYDFNYIPVELISRLYEEFLGYGKQGLVYTPPHLARLLVDESMPLNKPITNACAFRVIDPACGSGIFLVVAYKRLIQWWRINNNLKAPSLDVLKEVLINSVYGVDIEEKATQLTAFSLCLALCDELTPKQIWDDLKFDDISLKIFSENFFRWKKNNHEQFSLIIGNPPFIRGGIEKSDGLSSKMGDVNVAIPFKQISIKFFIESLGILEQDGLLCMIGNASSLLYNPSSHIFKQHLFSHYNVVQIFDFTHLARNKTLWDNAEPATVALFIDNKEKQNRNTLHVTFRRTKATKSRILFDSDDYDYHFVNRETAINNHSIWKNNLLGGGRIRQTLAKLKHLPSFENVLTDNSDEWNLAWGEGQGGGIAPPETFFSDYSSPSLFDIDLPLQKYNESYLNFPNKQIFKAPLLLIGENIGINTNLIPVKILDADFKYYNEIVGIHARNVSFLEKVRQSFVTNMDVYRFYIFCTSGKLLIYKNTSFKKDDLMALPFSLEENLKDDLSEIDLHIIKDVNIYMEEFIRHGEKAQILTQVRKDDYKTIEKFGTEFCRALNKIYSTGQKSFTLSEIIKFKDNKFIAVIFAFDSPQVEMIKTTLDYYDENFEELINHKFSASLNITRIIRHYKKNKIIFVKPNQLKYWLPLFAYRDADKTFSDLSKLGY
jgi:hypothetical protein